MDIENFEVPIIVGTGTLKLDRLDKNDAGEDKTDEELRAGGPPNTKSGFMFFLDLLHTNSYQRELEFRKITSAEGKSRLTADIESSNFNQDPTKIIVRSKPSMNLMKQLVHIVSYEPNREYKSLQLTWLTLFGIVAKYKTEFILLTNTRYQEVNDMNNIFNKCISNVTNYLNETLFDIIEESRKEYFSNPEVLDEIKAITQLQDNMWIANAGSTNVIYKFVKKRVKMNKSQYDLLKGFITKIREVFRHKISVDDILPYFSLTRKQWDDGDLSIALQPIDTFLEEYGQVLGMQ